MDLGEAASWAGAVVAALALIFSVVAYRRAVDREDRHEVAALRTEAGSLDKRLTTVEIQMQSLPTTKAVHDLDLSVSKLSGDVRALTARIDGLDDIVERVEAATARQEDYIHEIGKTPRGVKDGRG